MRMNSGVARLAGILAVIYGFVAAPGDARAQAASDVVAALNASLVRVMQNGERLGYAGRYKELEPALKTAFDLPHMSQAVMGPHWAGLNPEQRNKVIDAFTRLTIANFALRFDNYNEQRFEVVDQKELGGDRKSIFVRSRIVKRNNKTVQLNYLLLPKDGRYKGVDVYYNGAISEVATSRSAYSSVLARDGFDALVRTIEDKIVSIERDAKK